MFELALHNAGDKDLGFVELPQEFVHKRHPNQLRAAFAFASLAGAKALIHGMNAAIWANIDKTFIIGIAQGVSEPRAFSYILRQPNARLLAYVPGEKLSKESLFQGGTFHPKVLFFQGGKKPLSNHLCFGSANMTAAALDSPKKNVECGGAVTFQRSRRNAAIVRKFNGWWTKILDECMLVDDAWIERYSKVRANLFAEKPDFLELTEPTLDIEEATLFWIEVGKASGIERHQIEFPESLAQYFGAPSHGKRELTLFNTNARWNGRPLSYKKTTYGVHIWRLGTPTLNMGGEWIQDRVIRFERTGEPDEYQFSVVGVDSSDHKKWIKQCSKHGRLGKTWGAHGRRYGYC